MAHRIRNAAVGREQEDRFADDLLREQHHHRRAFVGDRDLGRQIVTRGSPFDRDCSERIHVARTRQRARRRRRRRRGHALLRSRDGRGPLLRGAAHRPVHRVGRRRMPRRSSTAATCTASISSCARATSFAFFVRRVFSGSGRLVVVITAFEACLRRICRGLLHRCGRSVRLRNRRIFRRLTKRRLGLRDRRDHLAAVGHRRPVRDHRRSEIGFERKRRARHERQMDVLPILARQILHDAPCLEIRIAVRMHHQPIRRTPHGDAAM